MKTDSRYTPNTHNLIMAICVAGLMLSGCTGRPGEGARLDKANKIAEQGHLTRRVIPTGLFDITTFTKIENPGQPVVVYIEGDGLSWVSRRQPSRDPSPTDPIALRLAAIDHGPNIIYLARPCQYSLGGGCETAYWTNKRFAPEVLRAMNAALDEALRASPDSKIRLVGFSGGGAIAAIMAAERRDVLDLRSVAGNLDPAAHSTLHHVSPLTGSLNPVDFATSLYRVPQHHFIGGDDDNVPASIYQSYASALNHSPCTAYTVIPGVTHEDGWDSTWKQAQDISSACSKTP